MQTLKLTVNSRSGSTLARMWYSSFRDAGRACFLPALTATILLTQPQLYMAGVRAEATPGTSSTFSAIGHINVTSNRTQLRCTGTRIAPGLVLTSAVCVFNFEKNQQFENHNIHFVAGVERAKNAGHATAKCVLFPQALDQQAEGRMNSSLGKITVPETFMQQSLALVVLSEDTSQAKAIPTAPASLLTGTQIRIAGYAMKKRQLLSVSNTCRITGERGNLRSTDCESGFGEEGGPVLVDVEGEPHLAGLTVKSARSGTLVLPVAIWPDMPVTAQCPQ